MTNDTYTKMVNCPEIQGQWKAKVGDWTDRGTIVRVRESNDVVDVGVYGMNYYRERLIYHPSQEDLQGMLPKRKDIAYGLSWQDNSFLFYVIKLGPRDVFSAVHDDFFGKYTEISWGATAGEALVQGVMHELHKRRWSQTNECWEPL